MFNEVAMEKGINYENIKKRKQISVLGFVDLEKIQNKT